MNHRTSIICRRNLRAYAAAFISYLMLAGQIAPLALGAARPAPLPAAAPASAPLAAAPRPAPPIALAAPNIIATKVDAFPDPNGNLKAEPGDTVTYTVTISNTGDADALGVTFSDPVSTYTTLTSTSTVLSTSDNYNTIGNVQINVPAAQGLLANDRDVTTGNNTGMTASGGTTSTQGGTVTISPDGGFTYDPPVGFNGIDTFAYTATTSGNKSASSTAKIVVAGKIWFVNNNAGACSSNCDGRLSHPFTSIANWQAVNNGTAGHPAAGDNIFVYESATSYTGPAAFLANQKLIGQDATASLITITALPQPSGTDPLPVMAPANGTIVNITTTVPATNAINVSAGGITLRGFTVGATTGAKIFGSSFGTLVVGNSASPDVTLNGGGQAINLTTGTLSVAGGFASVATTSSATQGITLAGVLDSDGVGGSSFSFGSTSVSGAVLQGILIGTTTADLNFGNTSTSGATDGVSFQNNSGGTRTFGTLSAGGTTGSAFLHGAGGGNVTVNGLATLSSAAANTVDIQNQAASTTVSFAGGATLTKSAGTNSGVNLNTDNGTVTFGGTLTIGTSGARFPAAAVTINGGSTGVFSLGTVSIFTNGFAGIDATNADGTLNVAGGTVDVNAARALNISGPAGLTTLGVTLGTVNSTGGTNNVNVTNAGGTVTLSGGALSGASGSAFVVSGGNPTVSFAGTLTQNNAGAVVDVQGTTGNSVSFTNTVTGGSSSLGVHIGDTTAVNGNVSFTTLNLGGSSGTCGTRLTNQAVTIGGGTGTSSLGTVTICTTGSSAQGIAATNADGTLNVTTGIVDASGARAINIDGPDGTLTTLGITLTTVSANGGPNGISIRDTNGSFTVAGNGGNCTEADQTCTGGIIQNTTGGDVNPITTHPSGTGVALRAATNISLTRVKIANHQNYGIQATGVVGFTLANSVVNGVNGNNVASPFRDSSVRFDQVTGTVSITNSLLTGGFQHNLLIDNQSGTATVTVTGCTIKNNSAAAGDDGFQLEAETTAVVNATITNNSFSAHGGDHFNLSLINNADVDLTFTGNSFAGGHANGLGQGFFILGSTFNGSLNYDISNNGTAAAPLVGNRQGGMINVNKGSGTGTFSGRIQNNFIGNAAVNHSGSLEAFGIIVGARGAGGSHTVLINSNTVRQYHDRGIVLEAGEGAAALNATVTNNTVDNFADATNSLHGIHSDNGILSTDTNAVCMDIQDNLVANAGNEAQGGADIRLRKGTQAGLSVRIPGLVGSTSTDADNKITAENPNATTVSVSGAGFTGGAACTQPTLPSGPVSAIETTSVGGSDNKMERTDPMPASGVSARPTVVAAPRATTAAPRVAAPVSKRLGGAIFRHTAEDSSAPLNPEPVAAQRRKVSAPVLTDAPSGPGGLVSINIGTLKAGDSVTITFQVVIDNPYGGGPNISNQGTVSGSNFTTVNGVSTSVPNTDDPAVGTNGPGEANPTLTPVNSTDIRINDASVAEPASGTTTMLFTLTLSQPAAGNLTVTYNTADGSATGGASCGGAVDYVTVTNGTATVASGSQTAMVPVTVCADTDADVGSKTLTVTISAPTSGTIVDNTATGTITQGAAGTFLISELRTSGPGGLGDDFVEFYNNTNSELTVTSSDGSAGYGLFKMGATCADTPVLIATIPNNTKIPARGHYLAVGSQYSLATYGATVDAPTPAAGNVTMTSDIESDRNVAVFSTANVANISSANRLDAVGGDSNTGAVCDLLREGTNLPAVSGSNKEYSFFRKLCDFGVTGCTGDPKDTNDNAADFRFVDTGATPIGSVPQRLGAPGPENLSSPIRRDSTTPGIGMELLDRNLPSSAPPNRFRSFTMVPNGGASGTLIVRRRVINNTGGNVTRLRYRIIDMSTFPSQAPGVVADLRAMTSGDETLVPVTDSTTCGAPQTPPSSSPTAPCTVTVHGTTLEGMTPAQPPDQSANGGGINSSLSSGTVTLTTPLANNASLNMRFVLGVQTIGTFRFYIIIEALP